MLHQSMRRVALNANKLPAHAEKIEAEISSGYTLVPVQSHRHTCGNPLGPGTTARLGSSPQNQTILAQRQMAMFVRLFRRGHHGDERHAVHGVQCPVRA